MAYKILPWLVGAGAVWFLLTHQDAAWAQPLFILGLGVAAGYAWGQIRAAEAINKKLEPFGLTVEKV